MKMTLKNVNGGGAILLQKWSIWAHATKPGQISCRTSGADGGWFNPQIMINKVYFHHKPDRNPKI